MTPDVSGNFPEQVYSAPSKILVIGAAGFVGKHLLSHLASELGNQIRATKLPSESLTVPEGSDISVCDLDITEDSSVKTLLQEFMPDVIIHLAAQSSVALSFRKPELTMEINIIGTLHVLEAVRTVCPQTRILLVGSSEQYGKVPPELQPVSETTRLDPASPYAISKMAGEALATLYTQSYALSIVMVRAFNHIGPGQLPFFVVSDFARQIALIEKGIGDPVLKVGNLTARRDFTDVRDIVRGYRLLTISGRAGEIYNIGSGKSVPVQYVLDTLLSYAEVPIRVKTDPEKFRPVDIPEIRADISKLTADTGWAPDISVETSLRDALNYWRIHV